MIRTKPSKARRSLRIVAIPRPLKLGGWRPLLQRWGELLDQYVVASKQPDREEYVRASERRNDEKEDFAHWYGERPLTGLLASAAWTIKGGWSLEEFAAKRGKRQQNGSGRGDLWLGTGKRCYTVEAKLDWPQSGWRRAVALAEQRLQEAEKQLGSLVKEYRWGEAVALCYLVPCLNTKRASSKPSNVKKLFWKTSEVFARNGALVATYRPPRKIVYGAHAYPGVIVIAEVHEWPE